MATTSIKPSILRACDLLFKAMLDKSIPHCVDWNAVAKFRGSLMGKISLFFPFNPRRIGRESIYPNKA
jgi:hypothetical protein